MSIVICSFERAGVRYYFDYSTLTNAPTTCAMKLREYKRYYFDRHGPGSMSELAAHLQRADVTGTSAPHARDLRATIATNCAGPRAGYLGVQKLLDLVLSRREGDPRCKPSRRQRSATAPEEMR